MEIATLRFVLAEDDLNNLVAKFVTIPAKIRDVRLRVMSDHISLAGIYDAMFPIPFDTEWKMNVVNGKITAQLATVKGAGVGLDFLKGYMLKELSSASTFLELNGDCVLFDLDRLLGEKGVPIKTNVRSVCCEDDRLVINCGQ